MIEYKSISKEIIVYSGDIANDPWVYNPSKHTLKGIGSLWNPEIKLYKELLLLEEYDGPEAQQYLEKGKKAIVGRSNLTLAALSTLGGPIIGALGIFYAYKKGDKMAKSYNTDDFACFRARLYSGKHFIAVAHRQLFQQIYNTHCQWIADKKAQ